MIKLSKLFELFFYSVAVVELFWGLEQGVDEGGYGIVVLADGAVEG